MFVEPFEAPFKRIGMRGGKLAVAVYAIIYQDCMSYYRAPTGKDPEMSTRMTPYAIADTIGSTSSTVQKEIDFLIDNSFIVLEKYQRKGAKRIAVHRICHPEETKILQKQKRDALKAHKAEVTAAMELCPA